MVDANHNSYPWTNNLNGIQDSATYRRVLLEMIELETLAGLISALAVE